MYSCEDLKNIHPEIKVLKPNTKKIIGNFKVQPIPLYHSVECIGFLIETPDNQKIVFATDTWQIPYKFKSVNHFFIESNNSYEDIIDNYCHNEFSRSNNKDHLELNETIHFLKQNYSKDLQNIILIHLSDTNIDAEKALARVKEELGFDRVWIAEKGLEIELKKEEF